MLRDQRINLAKNGKFFFIYMALSTDFEVEKAPF